MTYDPKYRMKHRVTPITRLKKQKAPLTMVGDQYFKNWLEHDTVLYALQRPPLAVDVIEYAQAA